MPRMGCGFCLFIESSAGMTHGAGLWGLRGGLGTTQVGLGWYLSPSLRVKRQPFSFAFVLRSGKRAGREFKIGSFITHLFVEHGGQECLFRSHDCNVDSDIKKLEAIFKTFTRKT